MKPIFFKKKLILQQFIVNLIKMILKLFRSESDASKQMVLANDDFEQVKLRKYFFI